MKIADLAGKKVALYGYGREGQSVWQMLQQRLPELSVTLLSDKPINDAPGELSCLIGDEVAEQICDFDVVIKSPGISLYRPEIQAALAAEVYVTSATRLWFAEYPQARTVCVTGTKGKSTTSSLIAHLAKAAGLRIALGGNIGTPLLDLPPPSEIDWYILELSSYQTSDFDGQCNIGLLLNLYPEHLDWHGSEAQYFRDKTHLLAQAKTPIANAQDPLSQAYTPVATQHFNHTAAWHVQDGYIAKGMQTLDTVLPPSLPGTHSQTNLCAALTVLEHMGVGIDAALTGLASFQALPHRLCYLGERDGIAYVDDSISTTPQSSIAALEAFPHQPITLLLGGYDRGIDYQVLAEFIVQRPVEQVILMPETGTKIQHALKVLERIEGVHAVEDLASAVALAQKVTPKTGLVLLSPAAPSYGQFLNFQARGHAFAEAAQIK